MGGEGTAQPEAETKSQKTRRRGRSGKSKEDMEAARFEEGGRGSEAIEGEKKPTKVRAKEQTEQ